MQFLQLRCVVHMPANIFLYVHPLKRDLSGHIKLLTGPMCRDREWERERRTLGEFAFILSTSVTSEYFKNENIFILLYLYNVKK